MPKKRGRKSVAELTTKPIADISRPKAPTGLDGSSAALWDKIVRRFEPNHFNDADFILLREFCHTSATLLPRMNSEFERHSSHDSLRARMALVKEAQQLATKLRLCVSARTRGDLASVRDAGTSPNDHLWNPPWKDV